ncbi:hypothetical protein SAMN05444678_102433 [Sphingomonas sp. YR710]|jgi:hypothetical protein|uniref:hypothetical protein n=1 Tax=Sphingomonas sp. YR710 TaxID=1882773 RepID=UPI000889E21E|nr:hypothetical protein [Sphingomonas sp. YR710]SDC36540.1 hypothetical protein SAMN05444678_102433 [Sphingomonas sp. YR710]
MIDIPGILVGLAGLFAVVAAVLWAFPSLIDDIEIAVLPSRGELIAGTTMLCTLMIFGAATLTMGKTSTHSQEAGKHSPAAGAHPLSWLSASRSSDDPAAAAMEQKMAENEKKDVTTLGTVLSVTQKCRATTGNVAELLQQGRPDASLVQHIASQASRNCQSDRQSLSALFMPQLASEICGKVISANESLDRAALNAANDVARLGGGQVAGFLQSISDAESNCGLALKS